MWRTRAVLAMVGAAGLMAVRSANATGARRVDIEWTQDDPDCIDEQTLGATIERTLGRAVFHAEARPSARIVGQARAKGSGGHEIHVALMAPDGAPIAERTLTTTGECRRLDESVAVVMALMIDSIEEAPSPVIISPQPPREPAPLPSPPPPPPLPPRREPAAFGLALGAGGGATFALLPKPTPYVTLRGEIDPQAFVPIAVAARVHAASDARVDGVGGTFEIWSGEIAACPTWRGDDLRLGACAGFGGGALTGVPVDLQAPHGSIRPIVYALAVPSAAVRVAGAAWLRIELGALVPLLREPWGYGDARGNFVELHRAGPVAPLGSIVIELRIDP